MTSDNISNNKNMFRVGGGEDHVRDAIPGGQLHTTSQHAFHHGGEPKHAGGPISISADGQPIFKSDRVTDPDPFAEPPRAEDTLGGATSQELHNGLGVPYNGQTSNEEKHDGQHGRHRQKLGQEQFGVPEK